MRGLRWLVFRVLILWIVAIATVGGAILIGRRQPIPDRVALLHLNDCPLPCWIGIIPGKTTLGEAQARIRQVYGNIPGYELRDADNEGFQLTNQAGDDTIEIRLWNREDIGSQRIFNEIDLYQYNPTGNLDTHLPLVGQLLNIVDNPSFVGLGYGDGTRPPALFFEKQNLEVGLQYNDCIAPTVDQPMGWLTIDKQLLVKDYYSYYSAQPWQGFRSSCYDLYAHTP